MSPEYFKSIKKNSRIIIASIILVLTAGGATAANLDVDFDANDFPVDPLINNIDNQYWPLISGMNFVYSAETEDGCEVNQVTVTSSIMNDFALPYHTIAALEVEDLEWLSEECDDVYVLMEKTTDWYAQDNAVAPILWGNIWYFGEETLAYDDEEDCVTDEGAWEAGQDGATPGIVMLADPMVGLAYEQEFLEEEAEDMGKVLRLNANVELESFGPYADCLVTKEWTTLERGEIEHKFYCPSAIPGLVLINELHGKTVRVEYIGDSLPAGTFPGALPTSDVCPE